MDKKEKDKLALYYTNKYLQRCYNEILNKTFLFKNYLSIDDIKQELFIQVYYLIEHYKGENLNAYLYRFVHLRVLDSITDKYSPNLIRIPKHRFTSRYKGSLNKYLTREYYSLYTPIGTEEGDLAICNLPDTNTNIEDVCNNMDKKAFLYKMIRRLQRSKFTREKAVKMFCLYYIKNIPAEKIANHYKVSAHSVNQTLRRCEQKIRKGLMNDFDKWNSWNSLVGSL